MPRYAPTMPSYAPTVEADRACLVLGGSTHSTLSAVRSLARLGLPTYAGVLQKQAVRILGSSRSCRSARRITASGPDALADELLSFAREEFPFASKVLVISTSERIIDHLNAVRDRIDPRFELAIPPAEVCGALLDKFESMRLAEAAGLQVPTWACVKSREDLASLPQFNFPVCVRPTSWSTTGTSSFKILICATPDELESVLSTAIEGGGEFIAQDYVGDADDLDVGMIWVPTDGSEASVWTGVKRRSSSPEGGVLAWGEAAVLPDVESAIRSFATTARYRGVGGIEFLRSGRDLWFIEFNPRLEAFHRLAAISGLDAPALIAGEWLGGTAASPARPTTGRQSAAFWVGEAWRERIAMDRKGLGLMLSEAVRFLAHRRRAFSIWSYCDPMPALVVAFDRLLSPAKTVGRRLARRFR